jgi:hypothetical protein
MVMQPLQATPPEPRLTPTAHRALFAVAVLLMLAAAVLMVAEILSAAIAIPVITIGIALVAIEQLDEHRGHWVVGADPKSGGSVKNTH